MNNDFLQQLNDSQRAAVEYCDGPQLVIAGAGSGKTRVLTYKIAYLLNKGLPAWNILALTFTNKAAQEMKIRIGKLVVEDMARYLNMGTFHSVFARILRVEADAFGFKPNFTIYDETDSRSLLKTIIKEMNLDDKTYKPANVHGRISMAKNHMITAERYAASSALVGRDHEDRMPSVYKIYMQYQERCRLANAMDFDDLLIHTYNLFKDHPEILAKYQERFKYILVDEYQDTNRIQQEIVLQLAQQHQRVCVVGDDAQSIYAFRGANIDNILDFQKVYPETKLFKLEQNYRSTQRIVQAANSLIRHNQRQIHKDVYSQNAEGDRIAIKQAYSDREEASIVCNDIKRLRRAENCEYSDFAVLYRTNAQSRAFEEEMRKQNIPYRIYGGLSFYQRKEIKDIIAYFRLVSNPDDEEAFKRIINYPSRGIGDTTVNKIINTARDNNISLWQCVEKEKYLLTVVNQGTLTKIKTFRDLIQGFIENISAMDVFELGSAIIKNSGIAADIYSNTDAEGVSRQENLEEFVSTMQSFVEDRREEGREREVYLPDFLQEVSLVTDLDSDDGDVHRVSLMTVHSAKGLEFPTVFVVGLEENIFPNERSSYSLRELEEERRLLYVAMTRAEKHCILTYAKNRWRYGKMDFGVPSRFLKEIDGRLIDCDNGNIFSSGRPLYNDSRISSRSLFDSIRKSENAPQRTQRQINRPITPSNNTFKPVRQAVNRVEDTSVFDSNLHEGSVIEHQRFGIGKVIRIEGTGENTKATVEFQHTGKKQLLLKFAKYKILENNG